MPTPAAADIGVAGVSPTVGQPGEHVTLHVLCGGCAAGLRLPIPLVPIARTPKPYRCGENALCRPRHGGPPRDDPFVFVDRTDASSGLRFAIPRLEPGTYAFVIYCGTCYRGPGGSLIAESDRANVLLRIRPGARGLPGTAAIWLATVGASSALVLAMVLVRRRRRRR